MRTHAHEIACAFTWPRQKKGEALGIDGRPRRGYTANEYRHWVMTRTWTTRDQDLLALEGYPSRTRDVVRARVALIPARVIRIDFLPSFMLSASVPAAGEACLAASKEPIDEGP